jgi:hypothetical protein
MSYALDAEALAAFRRDGFISISQFIAPSEVVGIRAKLLELHDKNAGFEEGAQFDAAAPDSDGDTKERLFPQILNPSFYARELTATSFHDAAKVLARQILGENARFVGDISFLKPARIGSTTPWHQDEAFRSGMFDHEEITIWLAVTPANVSNSCMSFIPGSHLLSVLEHRPMGGDPRVHALECVGDFDSSKAVECPLHIGGCTIHSQRTLHSAGPNESDDFRLAYALQFEVPPMPRREPHNFSWREEFGQTDRAARERAWRRRGGAILYAWRRRHVSLSRGFAGICKRAFWALRKPLLRS